MSFFKHVLVLGVLLATCTVGSTRTQSADRYTVNEDDYTGSELLHRWAQQEGKVSRWLAKDLFVLDEQTPQTLDRLERHAKLATTFDAAVKALITEMNTARAQENKMPVTACVFEQGDVRVVVYDLDHSGC